MVRLIKHKWDVLLGEGKRVGKGKGTRERDEREKKKGGRKSLAHPFRGTERSCNGQRLFLKGTFASVYRLHCLGLSSYVTGARIMPESEQLDN